MSKFLEDLYLPGPDEPNGVMPWGKAPEKTEQDLAAAVARLGGIRTPNYGQSYLLAADTLLRAAIDSGHLDHHGLPIFYLQRHSAELLLKEAILLGLDVKRLQEKIGFRVSTPEDAKQLQNAYSEHSLKTLLVDLEQLTQALSVGIVPESLREVVSKVDSVERERATWSRYSVDWTGPKGKKRQVPHMPNEVVLPLGDIQNLLQAANNALGSIWPFDGRLIGSLGEMWQSLARRAGEID